MYLQTTESKTMPVMDIGSLLLLSEIKEDTSQDTLKLLKIIRIERMLNDKVNIIAEKLASEVCSAQIKTTDTNLLDPYGENTAPYEGAVPENKTYAITNILKRKKLLKTWNHNRYRTD